MFAKTDLYRQEEDGLLHFVGSGECLLYYPSNNDDHVTIAIGDIRLHINREDFVKFSKQLVYNKLGEGR
jgi:hypothetical protein